jgi:3',5'-cyclic-AMP phosphodiesterase
VVRMFEGGYTANFWKTSSPDARAWSERTRGEYLGLGPDYQLGALADRNWIHEVDARRRSHLLTA